MQLLRFFIFFPLFFGALIGREPAALYLTWTHDPTSTMMVQWHTPKTDKYSMIFYQKAGTGGEWYKREGTVKRPPRTDICVHSVELVDLEADTEYLFRIGREGNIYRFRTLPRQLTRDLRFAVGGDGFMYYQLFRKTNLEIAEKNPDFVVIGGDLAYTHGIHRFKGMNWEVERWENFFREYRRAMVTSDGRLIPMIVAIGNHDVPSGMIDPRKKTLLFYEFFPFPDPYVAYRTFDVGSYLSLVLLDTGHTYAIDGEQTEWLGKILKARTPDYKFAAYHIAAYPSVYPFEGTSPTKIRKNWVPLFEQNGVQVAFENHNHAFKRSFPLKEGKVDAEGIFYLGDGAWGVSPRKPTKRWYLEKIAQADCFWLVTMGKEECSIKAFDQDGTTLDEVLIKPRALSTVRSSH